MAWSNAGCDLDVRYHVRCHNTVTEPSQGRWKDTTRRRWPERSATSTSASRPTRPRAVIFRAVSAFDYRREASFIISGSFSEPAAFKGVLLVGGGQTSQWVAPQLSFRSTVCCAAPQPRDLQVRPPPCIGRVHACHRRFTTGFSRSEHHRHFFKPETTSCKIPRMSVQHKRE